MGDYTEIETWIQEGRIDFGFLRLPTDAELETVSITEQDRLLVVLPPDHPLAGCEKFPLRELANYPFMLLEKGAKTEITAIFERHHLRPQVRFTTWDDYAIMSMVENGLGISILPELILQRIPYHIVAKELGNSCLPQDRPGYAQQKKRCHWQLNAFLTISPTGDTLRQ